MNTKFLELQKQLAEAFPGFNCPVKIIINPDSTYVLKVSGFGFFTKARSIETVSRNDFSEAFIDMCSLSNTNVKKEFVNSVESLYWEYLNSKQIGEYQFTTEQKTQGAVGPKGDDFFTALFDSLNATKGGHSLFDPAPEHELPFTSVPPVRGKYIAIQLATLLDLMEENGYEGEYHAIMGEEHSSLTFTPHDDLSWTETYFNLSIEQCGCGPVTINFYPVVLR